MTDNPNNHTRHTDLPATGETDLDEPGSIGDIGDDGSGGPNKLYQDDLDTADAAPDPISDEETDTPTLTSDFAEDRPESEDG